MVTFVLHFSTSYHQQTQHVSINQNLNHENVNYSENYSDFRHANKRPAWSLYLLVEGISKNALLYKNLLITLWVEETCHPKGLGSPLKHPTVELFVSL